MKPRDGDPFITVSCDDSTGASRHRLSLGYGSDTTLRAVAFRPVLVIGPQRSGKTTSVVTPAILEWEGPALVTSVRYDVVNDTLKRRERLGRVTVFDPAGIDSNPAHHSVGWSPLDGIVTWDDAVRRAAGLCEGGDTSGIQDGGFWLLKARQKLAPLLYAAAVSNSDITQVLRWVGLRKGLLLGQVEEFMASAGSVRRSRPRSASPHLPVRSAGDLPVSRWGMDQDDEDDLAFSAFDAWDDDGQICLDRLAEQESLEDRAYCSVVAVISSVLAVFDYAAVVRRSRSGGLAVADFLDGGNNTLFLCAPAREQRLFRPLFTALAREVIDQTYARNVSEVDPIPLLVCLDEAGNVARLEDLDVIATTAAGTGIQLLTVFHDLSQMYSLYGEDRARLITNNHSGLLFLPGLRDPRTTDFVVAMLQDQEVRGASHFGWASGDLRAMEKRTGLLVYDDLPALLLGLRTSFKDDRLLSLAR